MCYNKDSGNRIDSGHLRQLTDRGEAEEKVQTLRGKRSGLIKTVVKFSFIVHLERGWRAQKLVEVPGVS